MQCPKLSQLPAPPTGRTGWPWTEESRRLSNQTAEGNPWPRISVVTPSFNQGQFIEETIRSVLLQGYPNLEYLVIDGGSTDNSVEIIKKYSPWLDYWVSEPDGGQSDAINRGLKRASGDFATWINSDDLWCKHAIADHASRLGFDANVVYVGFCIYIDRDSNPVSSHRGRVFSLEDLVRIKTVWRSEDNRGHIDQPAVLFPRTLALSVGGLNTENHFTMDYELWGKLFLAGAKFQYTEIPVGMFREHANQKTHDMLRQTRALVDTAIQLALQADGLSEASKKEILADLSDYLKLYEKSQWKGSGRLAQLGLPQSVVRPLRRLRALVQNTIGGTNPL
jgi:glycosyltransferase involved in cell wall biosynthesis